MHEDPIVEEVRRIKLDHAARYGYDVRKIVRALIEKQKEEKRPLVSFPPRRIPAAKASQ